MKVQIIKTGEIVDLRYRAAQRLVLNGKARWYDEPVDFIKVDSTNLEKLEEFAKSFDKPIKKKSKPKHENNS